MLRLRGLSRRRQAILLLVPPTGNAAGRLAQRLIT